MEFELPGMDMDIVAALFSTLGYIKKIDFVARSRVC